MGKKNRKIKIIETGRVYQSIEECALHIKGSAAGIRNVLNGTQQRHKGYTFARAGETDKDY